MFGSTSDILSFCWAIVYTNSVMPSEVIQPPPQFLLILNGIVAVFVVIIIQ